MSDYTTGMKRARTIAEAQRKRISKDDLQECHASKGNPIDARAYCEYMIPIYKTILAAL